MEINHTNTFKNDRKKRLCAVKNPSERSKQSWFYNTFLGNLSKNKQNRNQIKVNWIMELTGDEVKLLKEKTCVVIELKNHTIITSDFPKLKKVE